VIVAEQVAPPKVRVALLALVLDVPVFRATTVPAFAAPVPGAMFGAVNVTLATDVNDPKRPKTNPAMAMAAMRVMAMSMTVAKTGLIAFLRLALLICIVGYASTRRCP